MDKITDVRVREWIDHFLQIIHHEYEPEKVLIFGSRARGDNLVDSDLDMFIVSQRFEGVNWLERIREVSDLWDGFVLLEPLCYTPQEFEEKKNQIGIVNQAVEEGIELKV